MIKTIQIDENKELTLSNNVEWLFIYRDQFGQDIFPVLMPLAASLISIIGGIAERTDDLGNISLKDIAGITSDESMTDALIKLSAMESVDIINITWAMAKAADPSLDEPRKWVRQFDIFPADLIIPKTAELAIRGVVSSKNMEGLMENLKKIKDSMQPEKKKKKSPSR